MRLIQLSSSDTRFKAITFEPGLNIIVGEQVLKDDKKKTSNGIGKSLSLLCIDFLLGKGSQSKEIKKLKEVMEKEKISLSLNFEHNGKIFEVTKTHNKIWLNDVEYKKEAEYITFLNTLVQDHSFRNIFARFFRTDKKSYISAVDQVDPEKPYNNNLINAYLLGLNLEYLEKKRTLKSKHERLKLLINELNILSKSINKEKEFEYEEKLKKIEKNLESFEIAEDFNNVKNEADDLTAEIVKIRNQMAFNHREIRNKKSHLQITKNNPQFKLN